MSFSSLLIRADGALSETEPCRYACFKQVFDEAGYEWCWDKASYSEVCHRVCEQARMAYFVRSRMRGREQNDDVSALVSVMHRRARSLFSETIQNGAVRPRPGICDLLSIARAEAITVSLASTLSPDDTRALVRLCAPKSLNVETTPIVFANCGTNPRLTAAELYAQARKNPALDPASTLVIEATLIGAEAARDAGYTAIVTRSVFCSESAGMAASMGVFDHLRSLISDQDDTRFDPMTADERSELLRILQKVHAGQPFSMPGLSRSDAMQVSDILGDKGSAVKTIAATQTIRGFAQALKSEGVGAMVVKLPDGGIAGIISERDVARAIADFGGDASTMTVADLMTAKVITCSPTDSLADVAKIMTERRIRHVPVVLDQALVGLISIGDVLKHRLDELRLEANVLRDYAIARK